MNDPVEPTSVQRTPAQRRHLRRILAAFVFVVLLMPTVALGGAWGWMLVPLLLVALFAAREAVLLRRTQR